MLLSYMLSYIEIPLLLTLSPSTSGNVGFNFFIGPALGFNAGCTISSTITETVEQDCEQDPPLVGLDVKSFEFGAMVGAGLEIGLTENASLVLDGLYNLGLTKMDDSGIDDDKKNRAFSILAGLSFSVGG